MNFVHWRKEALAYLRILASMRACIQVEVVTMGSCDSVNTSMCADAGMAMSSSVTVSVS